MQLRFTNTPEPKKLDSTLLPADVPEFISYAPNFEIIEFVAQQYDQYKNIVIIGNGGSINSFYSIYQALKDACKKRVEFVNTVDPDFLSELKQNLDTAHTLVITISKSGENQAQLEATLSFFEYKLLGITDKESPLGKVVLAQGGEIIDHPAEIGGRFAGLTEVAFIPAALCGFDVKALYNGGKEWLGQYSIDNDAYRAADLLYRLEQKGIVDVFVPIYNHYLSGFGSIIVQLCHETFGKREAGQTYFSAEAPESQHHTNQRFFGGRRNIAGVLISLDRYRESGGLQIPETLVDVNVKEQSLEKLKKWTLAQSMQAEFEGTWEDAKSNSIPLVHIAVPERSESGVGSLLAFWQLFALYSALIRGVDPFDQPQVEHSKLISFHKRFSVSN